MIRVTGADGDSFVVNEDHIIVIYDLSDVDDAEENAVLLLDTPPDRENTFAVQETQDELYYDVNFS